MTRLRRIGMVLVVCVVAFAAPALAPASAAGAVVPLLTGVRATSYPGYDRVVFDFYGGVPSSRRVSYVTTVRADGSGAVVPVAGRAKLLVRFGTARGHKLDGTVTAPARTAYALPNVLTAVKAGDDEGVLTYGIGLAKRQPVRRVFTLSNPPRVVVDIEAGFATTQREVSFMTGGFGDEVFPESVVRPVPAGSPAHGLLDRLFAGPTRAEQRQGIFFFDSGATGYTDLTISTGEVARVRLLGGCQRGIDTEGIADEIQLTLRPLPNVSWIKVYDPRGRTQRPYGQVDSIPECLEPVPGTD